MKIDIQRLDERIKKLQEIRRIAADPELANILLDFVSPEDSVAAPAGKPRGENAFGARNEGTDEIVSNVVKGTTPQEGSGVWPRNLVKNHRDL